mgnify:CR=1 FL=1
MKKNLTIKETFDLAFKHHKKNDFKIADNLYKDILKLKPNHFDTIYLLGSLSIQIKDFNRAIQLLQKAIEINSNHADAHNNLGTALKELGESEKSIECYQKAIQIQPNHADAHNNLGAEFKKLKKYKKSIYHYEKTTQINPNSPVAYSNLGNAYKGLGEYEQAVNWYKKAMQIDPKYVDAYYNLGKLFEELNEFEKAIRYYQKAIEIQPNHSYANSNLLFNICWSNNNKEYLIIAKKYYEAIQKYDEKGLTNLKTSNEKILKVGFVSADFRDHSVVFFLLDTFKYLRKKKIKLFAYSNNAYEDDFTKLIKQYFDNWELVFWDNQSTDNSAKIFNSYNDPRMKYYLAPEHTNLGGARARAYSFLSGEFFTVLDTDDLWLPTKIEDQLRFFVDESIGICITNTKLFSAKRNKVFYKKPPP